MKTRAEIYGNEAAALLRIVTMYPGLNMQQLLCFHPGKEEIIKTLLSHLQKQGRIFQTDTAEFISARTGLASVAVSSKSKQLGTWRISNYTPEFRETSGVGKRPVLTPDEVLRLPLDQALIIIRGKKVLQVDKMDYSKHPEAKYLRSCKASAHVPEWRRLEEEAAKTPQPTPKPAPAAKKPAKRKATKPASPTDKSPKEAPAPKSAGTPEGIITTDKDSILS